MKDKKKKKKIRCLEREDQKYMWERMQSLKWVRHVMDQWPNEVPRCIVQTLVAIVTHTKDEFRRICLDTLRELSLKNTGIGI